jgi:hypothetical protein
MHRAFPPSEPPDGERSRCFRLVIIGGMQLRGSWYLSAIIRLQGFSSGSPAASPRRWSPKTVTTSSMVGRSEPGCGLCPSLSFKDVCWGLVLKCFELRTRQNKMLNINALRPLKHYLPQGFNELRTKTMSIISRRSHLRD